MYFSLLPRSFELIHFKKKKKREEKPWTSLFLTQLARIGLGQGSIDCIPAVVLREVVYILSRWYCKNKSCDSATPPQSLKGTLVSQEVKEELTVVAFGWKDEREKPKERKIWDWEEASMAYQKVFFFSYEHNG